MYEGSSKNHDIVDLHDDDPSSIQFPRIDLPIFTILMRKQVEDRRKACALPMAPE